MRQSLKSMNDCYAFYYCIAVTRTVWYRMGNDEIESLWKIIQAYVKNRFKDTGLVIVADKHIMDLWKRCKTRIDKEVNL